MRSSVLAPRYTANVALSVGISRSISTGAGRELNRRVEFVITGGQPKTDAGAAPSPLPATK